MTQAQVFTAPDGTEMVIITRARYEALLGAEETVEDLGAAEAGAHSLATEGGIPFEVSNAIAAGKHPLAAWRKHRGLTQAQLADAVGMTQAAIARLEKTDPGAGRGETLDGLAAALTAPRWALEGAANAEFEKATGAALFDRMANLARLAAESEGPKERRGLVTVANDPVLSAKYQFARTGEGRKMGKPMRISRNKKKA